MSSISKRTYGYKSARGTNSTGSHVLNMGDVKRATAYTYKYVASTAGIQKAWSATNLFPSNAGGWEKWTQEAGLNRAQFRL